MVSQNLSRFWELNTFQPLSVKGLSCPFGKVMAKVAGDVTTQWKYPCSGRDRQDVPGSMVCRAKIKLYTHGSGNDPAAMAFSHDGILNSNDNEQLMPTPGNMHGSKVLDRKHVFQESIHRRYL